MHFRPMRLRGRTPPTSLIPAFTAGLGGGAAFLVVELAARVFFKVPTLPELVQDRLVQSLPGPAFAYMLDHLLYLGKPSLFAGLLTLQLILAGVFGVVSSRLRRPFEVAAMLWLLTGVVLLPAAGEGVFAEQVSVSLMTALAYGAYATALVASWPATSFTPAHAQAEPVLRQGISRRQLLSTGVFLIAAAGLARRAIGNLPALPRKNPNGLPDAVTPAQDFYLVSKNIIDPEVGASSWRLRIDGLVNQPVTLTYEDIVTMPSQQFPRTLECISNEVGGDLISNGAWTGLPIADVLAKVGPQAGAKLLHFSCVDGYTENMTIEKAMQPGTFLVYQLDGQPLPTKHGFPVRVLGSGTYGMKNPKWVNHIEVASAAPDGFWEQQGWDPDAVVQTMSRIDAPTGGPQHAGLIEVQGLAFAGDRGIKQVEISTDDGKTWQTVDLFPPLGPSSWVFWQKQVSLEPGIYEAVVRATDGHSQLQTSQETDTYPGGATGYHRVKLQVIS